MAATENQKNEDYIIILTPETKEFVNKYLEIKRAEKKFSDCLKAVYPNGEVVILEE
jgi:hypothetical protein